MGSQVSRQVKREVNDRIYATLVDFGSEDGDFLCECGDPTCAGLVTITLREYAARDGMPLVGQEHQAASPARQIS